LAKHSTYEETACLLLYGKLPTKAQLLETRNKLSARRRLPAGVVALISSLPHFAAPMDVLRTGISAMAMLDPNEKDNRIETRDSPAEHPRLRIRRLLQTACRDFNCHLVWSWCGVAI